jgi:hypothetical protein
VISTGKRGEAQYLDVYEISTRNKAEPEKPEKQLTNCLNH